jgi:hypothetical protein
LGGTLAHHSSPLYWSNNNCISVFLGGTLAHDSSPVYRSNSKLPLFVFRWHTGTRSNPLSCSNSKLHHFLFGWHTGTLLHSTVLGEFKTVPFCFWVAHWHTTQVYCTARIHNCISFFSGGTLANDSSLLYCQKSKLYLFVFWWHTGTGLNSTVLVEFITVSLCFRVTHWHTTYVYFKTQIKNYISFFSGGTLAPVSSPLYCSNTKLNLSLFRWHTGTLAHDSSILYSLNSKLSLFLFGWHTGTGLKYIVQLEFKTVFLSFRLAHWHTTQVHCIARIQNCISLFFGGTLAHDSCPSHSSNS